MYLTNANISTGDNQAPQQEAQLKHALLIIFFGVLVAMIMNGELGQWLHHLSEHNFALNVGGLVREQTSLTP